MPSTPAPATLPVQAALDALDAWQDGPSPARRRAVSAAIGRIVTAFGARGVYLELTAPPLPETAFGAGSLAGRPSQHTLAAFAPYPLRDGLDETNLGRAWVDGDPAAARDAMRAVAMTVDAAWSRAEARAAKRRLDALDQAVRGIAGVLSTERVLQLIVDRVRELSDAEYAALGIMGAHGIIEAFITGGISERDRARIGHIPRGHGILGLIIREGRAIRIDDIARDRRGYGFPPHHPEMHSFLGVPIRNKGRVVGNLYLTNKTTARTFAESDEQLVEMFALHAGIAIENARLHEELQRLAIVDERDRISQDLHDSIIQSLYALGLSLEDLPEMFADEPAEATVRLERGIDTIHSTIRDIRNLILGLRPALLENLELDEGIQRLGSEFRMNSMIDLEMVLPDTIPQVTSEEADQLLNITREALSNVARHSGATRTVLEMTVGNRTLTLFIGDNGRGFDPAAVPGEGHHGLSNLQSRAETLGGSLEVKSDPGGTQVTARIPFAGRGKRERRPKVAASVN